MSGNRTEFAAPRRSSAGEAAEEPVPSLTPSVAEVAEAAPVGEVRPRGRASGFFLISHFVR